MIIMTVIVVLVIEQAS